MLLRVVKHKLRKTELTQEKRHELQLDYRLISIINYQTHGCQSFLSCVYILYHLFLFWLQIFISLYINEKLFGYPATYTVVLQVVLLLTKPLKVVETWMQIHLLSRAQSLFKELVSKERNSMEQWKNVETIINTHYIIVPSMEMVSLSEEKFFC